MTLRPPSPPTRRRAGGDGEVTVFVADEQAHHPVDVGRWSTLAERVLEAEGVRGEAELSVLFVDLEAISVLNRDFMGEDGPTDVLSFPIDGELAPGGRWPDDGGPGPERGMPDPDDLPLLLGDVVICPAVAAVNAVDHGVTFDDEIALLVVHGILHLLGMDHVVDEEAERMERREQQLLDRFYRIPPLPDPAT
ncbi:MAG TPA: rRNA maturation RNase YbeY [Acidimicrobiales bacterium]